MNSFVPRVAHLGLGVALGLVVLAPITSAAKLSDAASACGAERNRVQAEFVLDQARDIWNFFPAFGISPELETDSSPAHVVVFRGDFDPNGLVFGTDKSPPTMSRVVCVVQDDGSVNLYYDVSRNGSAFED